MASPRKVSWNENDARRVAAATLAYERGSRDMPGVRFRQGGDDGESVRLCKTTAVWERDTIATLDVWEDGTPPSESQTTGQTVEAVNKMHKVAASTWVVVAKCVNGSWYLVEAGDNHSEGCVPPSIGGRDLTDLPGYDAAKTQALGHESGCLKWLDIEECQTETPA